MSSACRDTYVTTRKEHISTLEVTWGAENQTLKPALKILINNAKTPIIIYNAYLIWKTWIEIQDPTSTADLSELS